MSCYEWEHGTITLPSSYAPKLREVLKTAAEKRIEKITADTTRAWDHLKKMTPTKRAAVRTWDDPLLRELDDDTLWLLQSYESGKYVWRKPTQKQIREAVVSRNKGYDGQTNTVFHCGSEASITLFGNKVEWNVPENNHACERANSHPLAGVLFTFLDRVLWTARSGGQIVGNNEYNEDDHNAGGGGNYVVREYSLQADEARRKAALSNRLSVGWRR